MDISKYKETSVGLIPDDWNVERFDNVFELLSTNSFSRDNLTYEKTQNTIQNIHYGDIHSKFKDELLDCEIEKLPYIKDDLILNQKFNFLKDGDLIIADASEDYEGVGKCIEVKNVGSKKIVSGLHTFMARDNSGLTANGFRTYIFKNQKVSIELKKIATGTSVYSISKSYLQKLKFPIPSLQEQQKIAEILSTYDDAISTTKQIIDELKSRNKRLLNKLVNENRTIKANLGELGNYYNGLTGKTKVDFGAGKPYISYLNIFKNYKIDTSIFDLVSISENENQNKIKYGDIFFTVSSETPNEVGMSSVILEDIEEVYLNSFCFGYRLHNFETLHPKFASFYLRSNDFRNKMMALAQGATRFNLSKIQMMKLNIDIPIIEKQLKIANFLDTASIELTKYEQKLETLQEQKKGLMQQLLTGKTRVKI